MGIAANSLIRDPHSPLRELDRLQFLERPSLADGVSAAAHRTTRTVRLRVLRLRTGRRLRGRMRMW